MEKILYLEFDNNCSLEEIKEEMEFYQRNNQVVMTKINGIEIYSNDSEFEEIFERLSLNLNEEEYKNLKTLEHDTNVYIERKSFANSQIENTEYLRFYYGLAKTMIKPERVYEFESLIITYHYNRKFIKPLILATQIMLALEQESKLQIYREINQIINPISLRTKNDEFSFLDDLMNAISLVRSFSIKGEMVDEIFFKGTTLSYQSILREKINENITKIEKIKNKVK